MNERTNACKVGTNENKKKEEKKDQHVEVPKRYDTRLLVFPARPPRPAYVMHLNALNLLHRVRVHVMFLASPRAVGGGAFRRCATGAGLHSAVLSPLGLNASKSILRLSFNTLVPFRNHYLPLTISWRTNSWKLPSFLRSLWSQ